MFAPFNRLSKFVYPKAKLIDNPTALQSEKRPPTQSFIGKMFSSSIPKAFTLSMFVDTATKCLATASFGWDCKNQSLIEFALESVS